MIELMHKLKNIYKKMDIHPYHKIQSQNNVYYDIHIFISVNNKLD